MRHRVSGRKLGRDSAHRKALRKNMIAELLVHEQILTTEAKARMLRPAAEKIITMAKRGLAKNDPAQAIHARRLIAARIARFRQAEDEDGATEDVDVVKKLFDDIAPRYANRPGGYTRMVKIGKRSGDNADMAMIMLIDEE
ncbi:MAG: 50S ribosomal protein L17 [Anaerolineales bacterium]|nr:50S ribosomal protein L17 [Anaerolineales bacterium]MCB8938010.1 50S ribosomal protein L17 [Ardenticatenaceae bacterium]